MTVGDLKKALEGLPDDLEIVQTDKTFVPVKPLEYVGASLENDMVYLREK